MLRQFDTDKGFVWDLNLCIEREVNVYFEGRKVKVKGPYIGRLK